MLLEKVSLALKRTMRNTEVSFLALNVFAQRHDRQNPGSNLAAMRENGQLDAGGQAEG